MALSFDRSMKPALSSARSFQFIAAKKTFSH